MGAKYKTTINKLPKVMASIETLNGRKVHVGALEGEHAWLAGIHEYGCTIPVTPKMRAYLHRQGLHLKESTKVIKIPERSFLRSGHDTHADEVLNKASKALTQVIDGKMSIDKWLDLFGEMMASKIKKYIRDLDSPSNHPFTVENKGSSNPLVSTGSLIESITWKKE